MSSLHLSFKKLGRKKTQEISHLFSLKEEFRTSWYAVVFNLSKTSNSDFFFFLNVCSEFFFVKCVVYFHCCLLLLYIFSCNLMID